METIKQVFLIIIGFASGGVIAGGVFAFITIIGIVPRFVQKTNTKKYIVLYENMIILGGIFGGLTEAFQMKIYIGSVLTVFLGFCNGVFVGCLAVALAEVINVIPIIARRSRIQKGMGIYIWSLAIGKCIGSLLYFLVPGFFSK